MEVEVEVEEVNVDGATKVNALQLIQAGLALSVVMVNLLDYGLALASDPDPACGQAARNKDGLLFDAPRVFLFASMILTMGLPILLDAMAQKNKCCSTQAGCDKRRLFYQEGTKHLLNGIRPAAMLAYVNNSRAMAVVSSVYFVAIVAPMAVAAPCVKDKAPDSKCSKVLSGITNVALPVANLPVLVMGLVNLMSAASPSQPVIANLTTEANEGITEAEGIGVASGSIAALYLCGVGVALCLPEGKGEAIKNKLSRLTADQLLMETVLTVMLTMIGCWSEISPEGFQVFGGVALGAYAVVGLASALSPELCRGKCENSNGSSSTASSVSSVADTSRFLSLSVNSSVSPVQDGVLSDNTYGSIV